MVLGYRYYCGLQPPHPSGTMSILVTADMHGKWTEAGKVHPLTSHVTAEFLHDNVICRFGVPDLVRMDRGPKYCRQFAWYCRIVGIRYSTQQCKIRIPMA